jgi:hypothetical protein
MRGSNLQFLNTILSLETLAVIDLLLAVQIVLRERSTLSTVLAFLSNLGMQLNGPCRSGSHVTPQKNIGDSGILTSSGSGSSSSSAGLLRGLPDFWGLLGFWLLGRSVGVHGGEEGGHE